ncbi:MAG: proline dehydrogenase, partial [Candidatus Nephrothrix sp. EaCA]
FNREKAIVFNTYQLYLADKLETLKEAHRQAKQDGYWLGAKIVRGAYMEIEKARAEKSGYKNPVCSSKEATDKNY